MEVRDLEFTGVLKSCNISTLLLCVVQLSKVSKEIETLEGFWKGGVRGQLSHTLNLEIGLAQQSLNK